MSQLVSGCCSASAKSYGGIRQTSVDCDSSDFGICGECGESCEYIDLDRDEEPSKLPRLTI